jgi:hypothetical protein
MPFGKGNVPADCTHSTSAIACGKFKHRCIWVTVRSSQQESEFPPAFHNIQSCVGVGIRVTRYMRTSQMTFLPV